ncbi:hypothetical protein BCU68_01210 [Vibrio sp. 10N.286.49.B3]|uniref:glycosyltransferase family 4 protein n=1 Tax=Vibrio sp. 10N.286.49.B3 TaxID=1880855 RepID=UPI000CAD8516|nr:glycosyltransferase family 4 protein [Vibrio sp. 10N.286.49.B3]PMH46682.1 hypothetical protein BCU68_01210 [Vibrio sp. 10N.286.49.B3]
MELLVLAIARFRSDKKEAMSKNFVNLAEGLTKKGHSILAISPTGFESENSIQQRTFRKHTRYESLIDSIINLIMLCRLLNALLEKNKNNKIKVNIHIATPIELLIMSCTLKSKYFKYITLSIWQSYLTYKEFKNDWLFYFKNIHKYFHLLIFNSFVSAIIYRCLLSFFDKVIVHSQYQKEQLNALSDKKTIFIQNGVFPKKIFSLKNRRNSNRLELLYIGHSKPSKGVDKLIEIMAKLIERDQKKFHLTICLSGFGGQKEVDILIKKHQLEPYITFKNEIDVASEMTNADLLILPLRTCVGTSLTPNVIVEAISCGLPIAIPEFIQLKNIIKFDENAIRIDLKDMVVSAKSIENMHDKKTLTTLLNYQYKQASNNYDLDSFIYCYSRELKII